jgi:hypothetical protein
MACAPDAPLWERLRELHQAHTGVGEEIEKCASDLEAATAACAKEDVGKAEIKRMLGDWARARRLWCDLTGDSLV